MILSHMRNEFFLQRLSLVASLPPSLPSDERSIGNAGAFLFHHGSLLAPTVPSDNVMLRSFRTVLFTCLLNGSFNSLLFMFVASHIFRLEQ